MIRKTIFWLHLGTGIAVGLVVAMMSLTGVLLTYEQQMVAWADARSWPSPPVQAVRLSVDEIVESATASGVRAQQVTYYRDEAKPVLVGGGRRDPSTHVDAYTGAVLGQPTNTMREVMATLTGWHRWFDVDGESRAIAQFVTGWSNFLFLFLIVSGAYLWLPKVMRWPLFRQRLRFARQYRNARERDFYWHHVFAAWSFVPLIVVIATGVVISFPWANSLLTGMASGAAETLEPPGPPAASGRPVEIAVAAIPEKGDPYSLDDLLQQVMAQSSSWNSIAVTVPEQGSRTVSFQIDAGSGRQPHKRTTVTLDAYTGDVVGTSVFSDLPGETRAISWNRYLHTGESFGFIGQTIAGLVSAASLIMVWTGFALAWRRLIVPLYRRNGRAVRVVRAAAENG